MQALQYTNFFYFSKWSKALFTVLTVTVLFSGYLIINVHSVGAEPIPIGCPGSEIQGPPTPQDLEKCAQIPAGCPGSTQTVTSTTKPENCPYGEDATNGDFSADCKEADINQNNCGIVAYLVKFINILSALVGIVVIIMIAYAGIQYTMARDDPQQMAFAKNRIRNAVLALVFYFFIYAFLQWLVPGGLF